ncbi:SDR family oxidoreductase [Trinickia dinghuensis]|uniref:SDR family NAD(P)-dependent oxidoreductase n=1 Tax=Trinickia dinghuensis TaxID=2291023 RepID=A0A3D8JPP1_9BURK|nr:SDR family oxidoreductase [Trinickia dinghuensis]RDU94675.1 SDR family NAD(P)-dependent oxidoreductase [Trinickia dinghuensis]
MERVALITGACGGIGGVLCHRFVAEGDTVIALDIDGPGLEALARDVSAPRIVLRQVDLRDATAVRDAVASAVAATGPVDVLVANAGGARGMTLKSTDPASWQHDVELNLNAVYHAVEAVRESMIERRGGALVLIGSVNGDAALANPAYSAAKAGLVNFTKWLALELGQYGVRANIVCPGTVKTPAWQARIDKNPALFDALLKWYPLRDFATPDDIADAVLFLASPRARSITGVALPVDCGLMAGNRLMAQEITLEPL